MATRESAIPVVDDAGQFDDAEHDFTAGDVPVIQAWTVPAAAAPPAARSALDVAPAEGENEEELNEDDFFDDIQVDDEDWEISERDFTKQYNRLKQHIAVRTGKDGANGVAPSSTTASTRVPLPAINLPSRATQSSAPAAAIPTKSHERTQDQLQALAKYNSRLAKIADPYGALGAGVNRKGPSASANMKDKSDRATNEQVLDPRTRLILYKMIGRGLVHEVNGCVSTGKEANVYHALTPEKTHLALKIYKTSILVFKDRDRYVSGEYRFRRGYSRHNPRKMVRVWAEKEMRNLKRLVAAGVRCPEPVEVRENVLVMAFLGDADGWASPRLKDAQLPPEDVDRLYASLLLAVRTMFHACRLVHADLSEYNILYHARELYIIDVSQSVEHDHPGAFDFLRKDLANVDEFFGRAGARRTLGLRRSFDLVTRLLPEDERAEDVLQALLDAPRDEEHEEGLVQEDAVFKNAYIPRTLDQVFDPERDVEKLNKGEGDSLIYNTVIGVEPSKPKAVVHFEDGRDASGDELESESDEEGEGEEKEGDTFTERQPRGHRHEDRDVKKERKRAVKEEARERRKNKMPKAEKKKKVKATKAGK
ncbi:RIO1-domain-containing protein [Auricularia subglabra TFB-10046 SS5]|nr:RIO1-domain-containing protein [Auricularia subglabra TFB-10046 SS5]